LPGRMHMQAENRKLEREIAERRRFDAPIDAPLRRRVTAGFIVAVLLTLFIGFSAWRGTKRAEQDAYWVSHTHEVMGAIQRTTRHVIEADTSARAFALSGQEPLLAHRQITKDAIYQDEDTLRHLTADNLSQQRRLDVLGTQVDTALEFAENIVAKRRKLGAYSGGSDALEIERLLDAVRATTQDMYAEESRLLIQRLQRSTAGQRLMRVIAIIGAVLGTGLWVLAKLAVNREIDVSARTRAQLSTLNAELEQRVEQRTAALESEIVERERAGEALKKSLTTSEQALRELADQKFALDQHAIVATTDVQGTITYVNEKFCAISKYSRDELLGQNHRILNSGHHSKDFFQQMYHTIANGEVWRGEICNRAKDGSIYWVDTTVVPFLEADGKPRQYMAIRADISERKRAEEARSYLAAVVQSSEDAIVAKTLEGTITAWNPGAEKLYGYSAAEVLGKPLRMLLLPERAEEETDILMRVRRGEGFTHLDTVRVRKDGKKVDVSVTISPIKDANGNIIGASNIGRDVTERKHAEGQLAAQAQELSRKAEELARSNADLEQFAYVASHDLQEPLRMVTAYTQLLSERYSGKLDETANKFIGYAQDGAVRMQVLIQDLLAFSRVGRKEDARTAVDCNAVIEEVRQVLAPAVQESGAAITCSNLPMVLADRTQMVQLFQNLIGNAIKFRGAKPPVISVRAERQDQNWVFSVEDNGIGIDPEYAENIFVIFQRLHARAEYPGNGIGLAICKKIVERYGGKIWVESQPEAGSTFRFVMPARVPDKAQATYA
ncbi:MAG: PAS domain S-box protein, partial [Candidatus Sulfotelmatobacter sp.]